ncbi:hypothetical protein PTI98_013092 [Pleurotus ostreatus]|nr:hypothetical protein PTI98_013092 [Pleurotus ostreatus]
MPRLQSTTSWIPLLANTPKLPYAICARYLSDVGQPIFSPVALRTIARQSPGKKEKSTLQQGKCHKCRKWVPIEGVRETDLKVKEIMWWKHAAACHQGGNLEGEGDVFVEDEVFRQLSLL